MKLINFMNFLTNTKQTTLPGKQITILKCIYKP